MKTYTTYTCYDITNGQSFFVYGSSDLKENYDAAMGRAEVNPLTGSPKFSEVEKYFKTKFSGVYTIFGNNISVTIQKATVNG